MITAGREPRDMVPEPGETAGRTVRRRRRYESRVGKDRGRFRHGRDMLRRSHARNRTTATVRSAPNRPPGTMGAMTDRAQGARLAALASLLADPTRATFCLALLDGRAWTAGELARQAGVAASTASEHLDRLIASGLCIERRQGRHRYVALADAQTAALIEDLTGHLPPAPDPVSGLRAASASAALARGRTCYDHLAGRIGVAITDAMAARGHLDTSGGFALSDKGRAWMAEVLHVDTVVWPRSRRPVARECLDWTERRPHLAGLAGAEVCRGLFTREWIRRIGSGRAVRLTPAGIAALPEAFGIEPELLDLT